MENRLVTVGSSDGSPGYGYGYDPQNKRVMVLTSGGTQSQYWSLYTFTFYGITGQRLSTFAVTSGNYGICSTGAYICSNGVSGSYLYLAGKRLTQPNGEPYLADRLGSQRENAQAYYPWGEPMNSPAPTGDVEFATYWRDMVGQDYADQRYYNSNAGRFYTPDPGGGVDLRNPTGWNRYAYSSGDPINRYDPTGLDDCPPGAAPGATCVTVSASGGLTDLQPVIIWPGQSSGVGWGSPAYFNATAAAEVQQVTNMYGPPSGLQFAGYDQAMAALGNQPCGNLIAGNSGLTIQQLQVDLFQAQVTVGTTGGNTPVQATANPDGTYSYSYQWAYTSGGDIQLNGNYFPDPTKQNIQLPNGNTTSFLNLVNMTLGSSLNAQQLGTLVFLHELSHIADAGNQNQSNIDTNAYNQSIVATCVH